MFRRMNFSDTEEMSVAIKNADVSAVSLSTKPFKAELTGIALPSISAQYVDMESGDSSCAGLAGPTALSILVPLSLGEGLRLLGQEIGPSDIAVYGPKAEHVDTTSSGVKLCVLSIGDRLLSTIDSDTRASLAAGSHVVKLSASGAKEVRTRLSHLLDGLSNTQSPQHIGTAELELESVVLQVIDELSHAGPAKKGAGRPSLPRDRIMQAVRAEMDASPDGNQLISAIASRAGVSLATLRRVFQELYGMPPAQYLLRKRYYAVRRELANGRASSVSEVAARFGFWDPSRFAAGYKSMFGELPSQTLRRSGKSE